MKKLIVIAVTIAIIASTLVVFFMFLWMWIHVMRDCGLALWLVGIALSMWGAICYEGGCIAFARRFVPTWEDDWYLD